MPPHEQEQGVGKQESKEVRTRGDRGQPRKCYICFLQELEFV